MVDTAAGFGLGADRFGGAADDDLTGRAVGVADRLVVFGTAEALLVEAIDDEGTDLDETDGSEPLATVGGGDGDTDALAGGTAVLCGDRADGSSGPPPQPAITRPSRLTAARPMAGMR